VSDATQQGEGADRLVGWKAIAGHLKVSQRTAIRWAANYGLPVSRLARRNRPIVYASPAALRTWWASADATRARGEKISTSISDLTPTSASGPDPDQTNDTQENVDSQAHQPETPSHHSKWIVVLPVFACLLAITAVGYGWMANSGASTPSSVEPTHEPTIKPQLVEIRIAPAGHSGFMATVAEGEMTRLETPSLKLGLHAKVVGGQLKVFLSRLRPFGTGESVEYLESRALQPGNVERLSILGLTLELMWPGTIPPDVAAARLPRGQCCMVCRGFTVCGRVVSAACGGCQGELKQAPPRQ
jgi:hypothetical protein